MIGERGTTSVTSGASWSGKGYVDRESEGGRVLKLKVGTGAVLAAVFEELTLEVCERTIELDEDAGESSVEAEFDVDTTEVCSFAAIAAARDFIRTEDLVGVAVGQGGGDGEDGVAKCGAAVCWFWRFGERGVGRAEADDV
jgi:hypothetical protein